MACNTTGYTGQNFCNPRSNFGRPTGLIFALDGHTNTAADFLLEASWIDDVQAQQVFPIRKMVNFEETSTEISFHDYPNGERTKMDDRKYRFTASFDLNECVAKQVEQFAGFAQGIYLVYGDNIRGRTVDAGVNVVPIRVADVYIETTMATMDTPEMTMVMVDLVDKRDLVDYKHVREMSWDVEGLDGLTEVTLTEVSASATEIVIDVTADCGGATKQISGLGTTPVTDWTVENSTTFTGVTESSTVRGRYTLAGTGFTSGDVNITDPSTRSDDVLVISSGAVAVTI